MNNVINDLFKDCKSKWEIGYLNEMLITSFFRHRNFIVLHCLDNNKDYDLIISFKDKDYFVECKFDKNTNITDNFYFELYNVTYKRPTGIYSNLYNSCYSHTYAYKGHYYALFGDRTIFQRSLSLVDKDRKRLYRRTWQFGGIEKGDLGVIVNRQAFLNAFISLGGKVLDIQKENEAYYFNSLNKIQTFLSNKFTRQKLNNIKDSLKASIKAINQIFGKLKQKTKS